MKSPRVILSATIVFGILSATAFAQPPRHVGKHGGSAAAKEAAEAREANEKSKKKIAHAVNAKKPGRMKVETLKKTGHAESESEAYSKRDAWKWLFR